MLAVSNVFDLEQLTFLNEIFAKGKHLALFIDRAAAHSALDNLDPALKTAYTTLFSNFGVTFRSETPRTGRESDSSSVE